MERREVRWTEHGPVPVEEPGEAERPTVADAPIEEGLTPDNEETAATADLEAVRARLAERGLLQRGPSVRIRDLTEDVAPRSAEIAFVPDQHTSVVTDDPADAAGLEKERAGPGDDVRCPTCRTYQHVADDASGFVCTSCSAVWRWAICSSCSVLSLTFARQESWRCGSCGTSTRAWWRTPTASRENQLVRERRRDDAVAARRAAAYDKARQRRWKVVVAGVSVILLAVVGAAVATRSSFDAAARGTGARTCDAFVSANLTTDADPGKVRASLDDLAVFSTEAPDPIRLAAQRLATAGRPGDQAFEKARTALNAACR